jgi:hypothetical protein
MAAMTSTSTLYFDPDLHPDDTLRAFDEFIQSFELRYDAQYPDPPKTSLDAAIERWKLANDDKKPTLDDYDNIRDEWRSKDRVTKLLGIFSSKRLFADWKVAEPDDSKRAKVTWKYFVTTMQQHYKPTENLALKNHHIRSLAQAPMSHFRHFAIAYIKQLNTAISNATMTIALPKIQPYVTRLLLALHMTRSERKPSKIHGTSNNYARKECELKVPPKDWKSSTMKIQSTKWVNTPLKK